MDDHGCMHKPEMKEKILKHPSFEVVFPYFLRNDWGIPINNKFYGCNYLDPGILKLYPKLTIPKKINQQTTSKPDDINTDFKMLMDKLNKYSERVGDLPHDKKQKLVSHFYFNTKILASAMGGKRLLDHISGFVFGKSKPESKKPNPIDEQDIENAINDAMTPPDESPHNYIDYYNAFEKNTPVGDIYPEDPGTYTTEGAIGGAAIGSIVLGGGMTVDNILLYIVIILLIFIVYHLFVKKSNPKLPCKTYGYTDDTKNMSHLYNA